ncbi:thioesterase family protein [Lapillicoccus jejuensis]|uniref:Acyl-CoA thioesterase n=1 Tax=Lapillicoccus jejuensis TaxID=402171 RepID=A0A542DWE1_9MICO|nr:thioesterase family protein [Lapillicoccus jejuensis]TQJ07408.1 acyl-CoA thioesterase [Lapillicoccus jejuensis]
MTSEYDAALDLTPAEVPGRWAGRFSDGWSIGQAVNGGLVMAVAVEALHRQLAEQGDAAHPDLVAVSAFFLTASQPGPVVVDTEVLRPGRTLTTGQVSLQQPGEDGTPVPRMRSLVSVGALTGTPARRQPPPVDLPAPEDCVGSGDAPPGGLASSTLLQRLDLRLDPSCVGWAVGRPSGRGVMRGWFRFADGREPDPTSLLLALDGLPPVAFELGIPGWAPTLELTAHVWARPAPGWLRVEVTSEVLSDATMEEDARVWDSSGRLVAHSRQLCGVRVPEGWAPAG